MKNLLILFIIVLCSCSSSKSYHGIPNLALVEPGLWRGGQPNDEGWEWLRTNGVTHVVKLNEGVDHSFITNTIYFPINLWEQTVSEPNYAELRKVVALVNTNGMFVHCDHGQDRTGLVIGLYRYYNQGWNETNAYNEMLYYGFHPQLRGLKRAWDR
jgi:tyrosine-protein phosphatase SIW14